MDTPQKNQSAGEISQQDTKGKLVEYIWHLKKQGYSESTVRTRGKLLRQLIKEGVNLSDPEDVKKAIAIHESWCDGHKQVVVQAYDSFAKMSKIQWEAPSYKHIKSLPFIPLEREIDCLIAGSSKKMACCLQLLKETGMRIGEVWILKWTDLDTEQLTLRCKAEKHGNPRQFKISARLCAMLNSRSKKSEMIFATESLNGFRWKYDLKRRKIAETLQNPRLLQIKFHTFRHFKATMEYNKTKDILHVKQLLGHRNLNSTLTYTQLVNFESEEYTVRRVKTAKEEDELLQAGFEYVRYDDRDECALYRKRK